MSSPSAAAQSPETSDVPAALAGAVDAARAAAVDTADGEAAQVGEHVRVEAERESVTESPGESPAVAPVATVATVATHYFVAAKPGYRGWYWAVTVAAPDPSDPSSVGVDEVVLLPGPEAITAPAWVPWTERVRADDLSPGDVLAVDADDERLVPAHAALDPDDPLAPEDAAQVAAVADELGFGRARVMSEEGRLDAAVRWADGDFGPGSEMARAAAATCGTCGFLLRLAGGMRAAFGVCGNGQVPADGRAVHVAYGCGGHSELGIDTGSLVSVADVVYDDGIEMEPVSSS